MRWDTAVRSVIRSVEQSQRHAAKYAQQAEMESLYESYLEEEKARYELHCSCHPHHDWPTIAATPPPAKPALVDYTSMARSNLESYRPNVVAMWLGLDAARIAKLKRAVAIATRDQEGLNQDRAVAYDRAYKAWEKETALAKRIVERDVHAYVEVIKEAEYLKTIQAGSQIGVHFAEGSTAMLDISLLPQSHFPNEELRLTKTGKVSTRDLSQSALNERYLRHVCSAVLRMTAEVFALLPVDTILVKGENDFLDPATGLSSNQVIISAIINREETLNLNYARLDPVEALKNFQTRLDYRIRRGFAPVEPFTI